MAIDDEAVGFRHGWDLLRLSVAASSAVQKVAYSVRPPQFTAHYARAPRAARRGAELRRARPAPPAPPAVPRSRYRPSLDPIQGGARARRWWRCHVPLRLGQRRVCARRAAGESGANAALAET